MGRVQVRLAPALTRSPKALAGEAPSACSPIAACSSCWLLECLLLIAVIVLPERFISLELPLPHSPAVGRHLLLGRRTAADAGPRRRAGRQNRTRRRPASPPSHADHPRGARRPARETVVDAPKTQSAAFRFRSRQPARVQTESRTAARRRPAFVSHRARPARDEPGSARARTEFIGQPHPNNLTTSVVPPAPEVSHTNTRNTPALSARSSRRRRMSRATKCAPQIRSRPRSSRRPRATRSATWPVPESR